MKRCISLLCMLFVVASAAQAVEIYSVVKSGRMVQLDGFLLEWNKDSAKALEAGFPWLWDALATKEGFTGYFKTLKPPRCSSWTFTFLPRRLSPYSRMIATIAADAAQTFYRLALPVNSPDSSLVMEWVLPWDSIAVDSSGRFQIGLVAGDSCGDTLQPVIFNGRAYRAAAAAPWEKVYSRGIVLALLLAILYYLQKTAKRKVKGKKRRW
jgi:hypothetical protein